MTIKRMMEGLAVIFGTAAAVAAFLVLAPLPAGAGELYHVTTGQALACQSREALITLGAMPRQSPADRAAFARQADHGRCVMLPSTVGLELESRDSSLALVQVVDRLGAYSGAGRFWVSWGALEPSGRGR